MLCWIVLVSMLAAARPGLAFTPAAANHNKKAATLGFVSFDLDDTLFPTDQVVEDANHVMIAELNKAGYATTIPDFMDTTRLVRKTLDGPITYSDLRKRAIQEEIIRLSDKKPPDMDELVESMFEVWLKERHTAAERYLFPDSISMLEQLRNTYPHICIGAITNGRGNPLDMTNTLSHLFDFCVSGEDEGVFPERKPQPGIYHKALEQYRSIRPDHSDLSSSFVWCHVGDCLANDVGASAACGAMAVWLSATTATTELDAKPAAWSTATETDYKHRAQLAHQAQEKVAAQISCLAELPRAIETLLRSND